MTPTSPSGRQRGWMFTALGDDDLLMPEGIPARSLATMARRAWVQRESGRAPGPVRHSLTAEGRAALLTVPKLNALLSAEATGRISPAVAWPTLESLLREGLAVRLTDHGIPGTAAGPAYVSVLGRRLAGLPAVDERPAAQLLIEALAARGIQASVESDKAGNSHVAHRASAFEVLFYRVPGPGDDHSANHPAWMHDTAWYGFANREGDWAELARGLGGDDGATDSAKAADALVRLLSAAAS